MNNFITRTLSAAVYAAVVITSILVHPLYFGCVFLLLDVLAVREYMSLMKVGTTQTILNMLIAACTFVSFWMAIQAPLIDWGNLPFTAFMAYSALLLIVVSLVLELFLKKDNPIQRWGYILQAQVMVALPFALMNIIMEYNKMLLLALFIIIWVNDSGAYIIGSLLAKRKAGNHKMFPRVSPNKSWEGLIGGIVFSLLCGWICHLIGWIPELWFALLFALVISIFGTLGDLMESLMKRTIGVKDSGTFMPGHGGILDRFDSLLLATPAIILLLLAFCSKTTIIQ